MFVGIQKQIRTILCYFSSAEERFVDIEGGPNLIPIDPATSSNNFNYLRGL